MSLQVWLPLDGDLRNQGINNITITPGANATVQTDGKIGKCYRPATITLTNLNNFSFNNSSFCFWAKTNATTTWQLAIGIDNSSLSQIHGIYVADTSRYKLEYNPSLNISGAEISQWHHYAFIIQNGNSQAYYDGVLKATSEETITDDVIGRLRLGVGTAISLNDVRIYDHALSAAEVHEIAQGLVVHYKLDDFSTLCGNRNYLLNSTGMFGADGWSGLVSSATDTNGAYYLIAKRTNTSSSSRTFCHRGITSYVSNWAPGTIFIISGWYMIPSLETYAVTGNMFIRWQYGSSYSDTGWSTDINAVKDTWIRFEKTFAVPANYDNSSGVTFYLSAFSTGLSTIYWKNIKLELGTIATNWCPADNEVTDQRTKITDCSGYWHDGTITGALTLSSDTPKYSAAITSNAAASILNSNSTIPTSLTTNNKYTMCAWLKTKATNNRWIYSIGSGTGGYRGLWLTPNGSKPHFAYSGSGAFTATTTVNDNAWHHIVFTVDGATSKCFVDGTQCGSSTSTKTDIAGNNNITITFNGSDIISDFRLYCTALSATDILSLYHTGARMDNLNNLHTFSFEEKDDNYSEISLFNGGAYDETTTGKISAAVYSRAISPAPRQTNATISANHYSYIYTTKFSLNNYGDYKITIPTCTITPYPYTYTSTYWRRSGSTYIKVNNTPRYGRFAYIRVYLILYNSNYEELGSELIKSAQYIKTESDSSSLSSDPISLSGTYNFNLPFDFSQYDDIAYGSLKVEMAGNSPDAGTEFSVVQEFSTSTPQLLKTGVFVNKQIHEQTTNKVQFLSDGTFNIEQAIEV